MPEFDPREAHLKYEPAPERPHDFDRKLKQIVDRCPTGEPYLRFVWGMDQTEVLDGNIIHRYPDPDGVNVGVARWVLEGWQSPDVYNKVQWKANEDILGPFPANGVWDFIALVENEKGQYLPLGSHALQMARDWRHWRSKPTARALEDLITSRAKIQVLKEKRWEARKEEILGTLIRDYSNEERGGHDPRRRTTIAKITSKGEYQQTPSGILIPKFT